MVDIDVEFGHDSAPCVISVSGEVDVASAATLSDAGITAVEQMTGECPTVVIDLHRVEFMDSAGLGALVIIATQRPTAAKR